MPVFHGCQRSCIRTTRLPMSLRRVCAPELIPAFSPFGFPHVMSTFRPLGNPVAGAHQPAHSTHGWVLGRDCAIHLPARCRQYPCVCEPGYSRPGSLRHPMRRVCLLPGAMYVATWTACRQWLSSRAWCGSTSTPPAHGSASDYRIRSGTTLSGAFVPAGLPCNGRSVSSSVFAGNPAPIIKPLQGVG